MSSSFLVRSRKWVGASALAILVGLGGGRRRRPCAARLRHADRRLGDPAGRLLRRPGRAAATARRRDARRAGQIAAMTPNTPASTTITRSCTGA